MPWTVLLDPTGAPGWYHMAVDQALLDRAEATGASQLRLYRWAPACLSFGRHEPVARRYDLDRIRARGIDTVRRPTGGRAVWHDQEVTYSVTAPLGRFGSLSAGYRDIHQRLASALGTLGAVVNLAGPRSAAPLTAGACFSTSVGGEVLHRGAKLVGSAQLKQGSAFLQHGSILLSGDQSPVRDLLNGPAVPGGETSLLEAMGREVMFDEVARAVIVAFGEQSPTSLGSLPADLVARVAGHAHRFQDPAWTFSR